MKRIRVLLFLILIIIVFNFQSPPSINENEVVDSFNLAIPKLRAKENTYKLHEASHFPSIAYSYNSGVGGRAYIVVDFDKGEILFEKNSLISFPVASLTKIMTAMVALDLAKPSDTFTISENAADQVPTKIGVVAGQKMTLEELLSASLITSANDATEVIKEGINKKYRSNLFEKAMNEKAKFLGLRSTHFDNPCGFDGDNYSSAHDLAILSYYALKNYPLINSIVKKDYEFLPENRIHKQFDLYNWNGLVGVYPGVFGIKIGSTDDAGVTTIVASEREEKKVLIVLLGAPGVLERDLWAAELLDDGFELLANLPRINISEFDLSQKYSTWKYW